jgi:putative ABC transport system permease protein
MWMIALRDLQWRRRRFIIAVLATALVFALTLLLSGAGTGLRNEATAIVDVIDVDAWVVPEGTSGPFTASSALPAAAAGDVAEVPGVRRADPLVFLRATVGQGDERDVNVIGYTTGGVVGPAVDDGRLPERPGETLADSSLGYDIGEELRLNDRPLRVVGERGGITFNFGVPTLFVPIEDVQALAFGGSPLATSIVTDGAPRRAPAGLTVLDRDQVVADMRRPMASGLQTIDFINVLLWIIAAGIIGSIVYLSSLERARDFAVLKATGAADGALLAGLALQAVVLSVAAAAAAVVLARLLEPGFPFAIQTSLGAYVLLPAIAVAVGLLASLAGLRRAMRVDPALAFGGA